MARIVRPKEEKRSNAELGIRNAECEPRKTRRTKAEMETARAAANAVTEKELWDLRRQIAGALNRIDELEAQVLILARGGKEKEFYSVEEAAEIWGVSKSNLYLMIRQGRLPAIKIGETVRIARGTLITGPTE